MKLSAQEEYGLRILLEIAKNPEGLSIAEISEKEKISQPNAAKICRLLRMCDYIESTRGHQGGYKLSKPPAEIELKPLLSDLGGRLYDEGFCERFTSSGEFCTKSTNCSIKSLWQILQNCIDEVLDKMTLANLIGDDQKVNQEIC